MDTLFLSALDRSLDACWVVLAVLVLRLLLKKAPRGIHCCLWALVAVRLVCPFSFESVLSLMPESSLPQMTVAEAGPVLLDALPAQESDIPENRTAAEQQALPVETVVREVSLAETGSAGSVEAPRKEPDWPLFCGIVWLMGTAGMAGYAAVSYLRLKKRVGPSLELGNGVFLCDYIDSPFILGILHPRIYLPSDMDPRDASHVLAHERAHLKRKDHWWKPLGFLLLSVYWFNPVLWLAYVLLCRDIELACDERVVQDMALPEKKAYSEALLKCSVPRHMIVACPLAFGEVGVKERVRNVLHYKKPGFWIVLITVVLCLAAGICFLTDPVSHTLDKLVPLSAGDIDCFYLLADNGTALYSRPQDVEALLDTFHSVTYSPETVSGEAVDPEWEGLTDWDRETWNFFLVEFQSGDRAIRFHLSNDYRFVWITDENGTTAPYPIENGEILKDFMELRIRERKNAEISGEPFATADQPVPWLQQVQPEHIQKAALCTMERDSEKGVTQLSTLDLPLVHFQELMALLNRVKPGSVTKSRTLEQYTANELRYVNYNEDDPEQQGFSIIIADGVNDLSVYLRLSGGHLELILIEGTQWLLDHSHSETGYHAQVWTIADRKLQKFLQELYDHPSWSSEFTSESYVCQSDEPMVVSYENAQISASMLEGWIYTAVPYEEGAKSFGILCRPEAVAEGWIYFSFWPEGYEPEETDRYYLEGRGMGYPSVSSWPKDVEIPYQGYSTVGHIPSYKKTMYPTGDYAIINQGADGWYLQYSEMIYTAELCTRFTYGSYDRNGFVRTYSPVTVDVTALSRSDIEITQLLYHDWDKIMRGTGAGKLTLLAGQQDGDDLYLAGEYEGNYCFLRFENTGEEGYAFRSIRYGSQIRQYITENGAEVWYTEFTSDPVTKEDARQVTLILDHRITGVGIGDYQHIDSTPALLVIDPENWTGSLDYEYILRYDDPPAIQFDNQKGLGNLSFREVSEEDEDVWYLHNSQVGFYDGIHAPGGYSLEDEDLEKLKDILISLPKDTMVKCAEPEESELHVRLVISIGNGKGVRARKDNLVFTSDGEKTCITLSTSRDGKWADDVQEYHYLTSDAALMDFLETLCDNDRKSYNIAAVGTEETIHYSHGDGNIVLNNRLGWEFEIVAYTDEETPFGIRCRPKEFHEGWVFFSYWPKGFPLPEGTSVDKSSAISTYGYDFAPVYASEYKTASCIGQILRSNAPGDYVILHEGADSWLTSGRSDYQVLINTLGSPAIDEPLAYKYTQGENRTQGPGSCLILSDFGAWGYLDIFSCWMYSYEEEQPDYHAFRFWPEWETEGYIRFSSISERFVPEEGLIVESFTIVPQSVPTTFYTATAAGESRWNYLWIEYENGCLIWENVGTAHWADKQWQEVMEMIGQIQIARVIP